MYRTRGISKQILMDLNIPLQDAALPFPMPRISQQAGAPFLGTVTLNSASQGLSPATDKQHCSKGQVFAVHGESCLLGRSFGVLRHTPAVTRRCHSHFLLSLSAEVIRRADNE